MRDTINLNKIYNSWLVQYDVYNYTLLILFLSYTLQITIYNLKQLLEKKQKKSSWLLLNLLFILMIDDKPFFITQREPFLHYIYTYFFFHEWFFNCTKSSHEWSKQLFRLKWMSSENFAMLKMVRYNATSFTLIIHAWDVTGGDKTWIMVKHIYINVFNFSNLFKVKVAFSQKKKG